MSNALPPLSTLRPPQYSSKNTSDIALPPIASWSNAVCDIRAFSSPSHRSSSPLPTTPFSTRRYQDHAHIRSSPPISSEIRSHHHLDHSYDAPHTWGRRVSPEFYKASETIYARPSFTHTYVSGRNYLSSSDFDAFKPLDELDIDIRDAQLEGGRGTSMSDQSPVIDSDTEEEQQEEEDEGFSFPESHFRTTFFQTSAERGRWKTDPMPFKSQSFLQLRKSVPGSSPPPMSQISQRRISEPALSTSCPTLPPTIPEDHDLSDLATEPPSTDPLSSEDHGDTLPSLATDSESSPEMDEVHTPSSPLPPSSPPLPFSMSVCPTPLSRSVSPLSFAPSSPLIAPSSPLSMLSSLGDEDEEITVDSPVDENKIRMSPTTRTIEVPNSTDTSLPASSETLPDLKSVVSDAPSDNSAKDCLSIDKIESSVEVGHPVTALTTLTSTEEALPSSKPELLACELSSEVNEDSSSIAIERPNSPHSSKEIELPEQSKSVAVVRDSPLQDASPLPSTLSACSESPEMTATVLSVHQEQQVETGKEDGGDKVLKAKDGNSISSTEAKAAVRRLSPKNVSDPSSSKEKRKDATSAKSSDDGPMKKKRRISNEAASSSASKSDHPAAAKDVTAKKAKAERKRRLAEEENEFSDSSSGPSLPKPKAKKQKQKHAESSSSAMDPENASLHSEIGGMLIESMALSRASSLTVSSLYKLVMEAHPALRTERTEKEWTEVFQRVLETEEAGSGSGMFGKVESSGKDDAERPLEARWFYVPEQDEDQDRATLIRSMMPRPGKRNETKKYKQYYWRPLDKISRWDPEDDL